MDIENLFLLDELILSPIQEINVSRRVTFGVNAVERLTGMFKDLGINKLHIFSGQTKTQEITEKVVLPQLSDDIEYEFTPLPEYIDLSYLSKIASRIDHHQTYLLAVGGGTVIDYVKLLANMSKTEYIAVPTNASHDGFSSPYISFLLRTQADQFFNKELSQEYRPISPLAIVGDTTLISKAPKESLKAGVGDILSKWVAVKDWRLANRLKGEDYDIYAASFSEMTATMVEERINDLGKNFFGEKGVRALIKALGSSGVAMCIAGSSRPASGSEHLVSHALDMLSSEYDFEVLHGHQTGISAILMMYLHGGDWNRIRTSLKKVSAPLTLRELGIDRDIMLLALQKAQHIRSERYTVLSEGLTRSAAENAIEKTGID
ncbi:MAG: iron-containing alcohol dehydrogenase [Candidatus Hodarchaeales archaeon]